MSIKNKALLWLGQFLLVCLLLAFNHIKQPLQLNGDLTALFADKKQSHLSKVTDKISQIATNKQVVLVGAKDLSQAIAQADKLTEQLNALPLVSSAQTRFDQLATFEDIVRQYLPYQQQLLTPTMRKLLQSDDKEELFSYQFSLLNQVSNQAVALTLSTDASLSLADFLSRPVMANSALSLKQEHLLTYHQEIYYVLVIFTSQNTANNIDAAQQLVNQFEELVANNAANYFYTGALFYTSKASRTGQFEMMLYGSISLLATLLLIVWFYRSFIAVVATFTLVIVSFIYGYLALSQVYSEINIIAFVFSVTLIGIAVDYSFHALTQLRFSGDITDNKVEGVVVSQKTVSQEAAYQEKLSQEIVQPINRISASLLMSFVTTGAGYGLLMFAPFILFQQIALFTLSGLFGALITVILLFPLLAPLLSPLFSDKELIGKKLASKKLTNTKLTNTKKKHQIPAIVSKVNSFQQSLITFVKRYKLFVLTALISCMALMTTVTINNDIRAFYSPDSQLKSHENKVNALLKQQWQLGYFLVQSTTKQGVLEQEERLVEQLDTLIEQGQLRDISAISQWLPSVKSQQQNRLLLEEGLAQGKFSTLQELIPQADWQIKAEISPLTLDTWLATDVGKMYQTQWIVEPSETSAYFYSVVRIAGIAEVSHLKSLASTLSQLTEQGTSDLSGFAPAQVFFIDNTYDISAQLTLFSQQLVWLLMAAIIAAFAVFVWRYGFYAAVLGVITPVFSLLVALLLSQIIQESLNIFNLVAGLLIIALGLDYSVFYAEHGLVKKVTLTTLMSALSSVFVFAMLIFSSMSVIVSFGLTIFIGVASTFLLAPIVTLARQSSPK